jgi:hypothetical protein
MGKNFNLKVFVLYSDEVVQPYSDDDANVCYESRLSRDEM